VRSLHISWQVNVQTMEVSVLPGRERHRRWNAEEKLRIIEESHEPGMRVAEVARRHGLQPNQLHAWRRRAPAGVHRR
jgi:transposase